MLFGVIVVPEEDLLDNGKILLVLILVTFFADDLVGILEFLEVLIGGEVVGLRLQIVHWFKLPYMLNNDHKFITFQANRRRLPLS